MDKTIKVSEATYKRIERLAKRDRRTIKATVEVALDYMEGLVKEKRR